MWTRVGGGCEAWPLFVCFDVCGRKRTRRIFNGVELNDLKLKASLMNWSRILSGRDCTSLLNFIHM